MEGYSMVSNRTVKGTVNHRTVCLVSAPPANKATELRSIVMPTSKSIKHLTAKAIENMKVGQTLSRYRRKQGA